MTALYRAYNLATRLALPFVARGEARKLANAGMGARAGEKRGLASAARPEGTLIWFHAASVGESLSVLSLITRMGEALPQAEFLITSGTPTSAQLIAQRMPPRCRHQFAPLDAPGPVTRFLAHWRPDAAIFVESELWPQMLMRSTQSGVPLALVNARLSERSLTGWSKRPKTAAMILRQFRLVLTQTDTLANALINLGARPEHTEQGPNLKSLSAPLPVDAGLRDATRAALKGRPVWVAASTHAGEEEMILHAHAQLLRDHPDLCLILAPSHPDRADDVAALIEARGWPAPRRSQDALPGTGPVYLADSLGELGAWYALSPIVFLGGSLKPIGGHNPFEVAQAGAATLSGPNVTNFADTYEAMTAAGAATLILGPTDLAAQVALWLDQPQTLARVQHSATAFCADRQDQLDDVTRRLIDALELGDA